MRQLKSKILLVKILFVFVSTFQPSSLFAQDKGFSNPPVARLLSSNFAMTGIGVATIKDAIADFCKNAPNMDITLVILADGRIFIGFKKIKNLLWFEIARLPSGAGVLNPLRLLPNVNVAFRATLAHNQLLRNNFEFARGNAIEGPQSELTIPEDFANWIVFQLAFAGYAVDQLKDGQISLFDLIAFNQIYHVGNVDQLTEALQILANRGLNLNLRDALGNTPLMAAVANQNAVFVRALRNLEVDLDAVNTANENALDLARRRPSLEILAMLQDTGDDTDTTQEWGEEDLTEGRGLPLPAFLELDVHQGLPTHF